MDWYSLIIIKQLRNPKHIQEFGNVDIELAQEKMASCIENKWNYGYNSISLIFSRLPIFWVISPLLYLLKITKVGELLYRELATKRNIVSIHCKETNCSVNQNNDNNLT